MSTTVESEPAQAALAALDAAVDGLLTLDLDPVTDADVLAVWQGLEAVTRRLAAVDHRVIGQIQTRHLGFTHGATSVAVLARQVLRIPVREAKARVCAADAAGPRVGLSGETLPPIYETVAAAQRDGSISAVHARMIVQTIDRLPAAVQASDGAAAEQLLTEHARVFDPDTFGRITQRLTATLDPDGSEPDFDRQHARRSLRLSTRPDGSGHLHGELTAEATEHLRTVLDALARPVPADGGIPDVRSAEQRNHDGLLDLVRAAQRAELLPNAGGVTTTLILTCDVDDWRAGTGRARTGHGLVVPTPEAHRWVSGDTRVIGVALDRMKSVQAYGDAHRIFTENQRLAMISRDKGCVFPGCDAPPQRCQAHHITEHAAGGSTSVSNGCLLCSFHHREFERMGWRVIMCDGLPHVVPPDWLDPAQLPRRNTIHDPAAELLPV